MFLPPSQPRDKFLKFSKTDAVLGNLMGWGIWVPASDPARSNRTGWKILLLFVDKLATCMGLVSDYLLFSPNKHQRTKRHEYTTRN